jgi:hypothetical protein
MFKNCCSIHSTFRNPIKVKKAGSMMCQTKAAKTSKQTNRQTTKRINVTGMPLSERRRLFIRGISQTGFIGFIKSQENKQTYYIFRYESK